jgi:hypothetical protein
MVVFILNLFSSPVRAFSNGGGRVGVVETKRRDLVDHASSTSFYVHSVVTQTETAHMLLVRVNMVLSGRCNLRVHDGSIIPCGKRVSMSCIDTFSMTLQFIGETVSIIDFDEHIVSKIETLIVKSNRQRS